MIDFHKMQVWEKSHKLALEIYRVTSSFPGAEQFGLVSQLRRAVVSVPSNIAEGCGKGGNKELRRFLEIASGSLSEVEYQLLLSRDLKYIDEAQFESLNSKAIEVKRMLATYIKKIKESS